MNQTNGGSTAPRHPTIKGSNPAPVTGRDKMAKS